MGDRVRIANAGGYWGDDPEALLRQVRSGTVDDEMLARVLELDVPEAVLAATQPDGEG